MVGTKEFNALKDTEQSSKAQEFKFKPSKKQPQSRECNDCGRIQRAGRVDPADGVWYCDACWASMTVDQGPQICAECGKTKVAGSFDPSDGQWYCEDCWAAF